MTKPWNVVAAAMAVFGFVYGYVGTAGAPFCGSMGTCLQFALDRGLAGFAPTALIPGAIAAVIFAAVVYVFFVMTYGIRKALHRLPYGPDGLGQSTQPIPWFRGGRKLLVRPTPLIVALGVGLAWAVLSVGPSRLASDFEQLIPRDTVTSAFCLEGAIVGGRVFS